MMHEMNGTTPHPAMSAIKRMDAPRMPWCVRCRSRIGGLDVQMQDRGIALVTIFCHGGVASHIRVPAESFFVQSLRYLVEP